MKKSDFCCLSFLERKKLTSQKEKEIGFFTFSVGVAYWLFEMLNLYYCPSKVLSFYIEFILLALQSSILFVSSSKYWVFIFTLGLGYSMFLYWD